MQMPGRKYIQGNSSYRYGFNGKENDKDISEGGQDYGMRIYDGRLGRFLSVDPLFREFSWNSTYAFAENDVIRSIDLDGGEKKIIIITHWWGSDGTMLTNKMTLDGKNMYALGNGVLTINKFDYTSYDDKGQHGDITQHISYEPPSFFSEDWWSEDIGKGRFGFILTGRSGGGSSIFIGDDNTEFEEVLDIGVLMELIGNMKDYGETFGDIKDFIKNKNFKAWYDITELNLKIAARLVTATETASNDMNEANKKKASTPTDTKSSSNGKTDAGNAKKGDRLFCTDCKKPYDKNNKTGKYEPSKSNKPVKDTGDVYDHTDTPRPK